MWVYNLDSRDPHTHVPRVIAINLVFAVTALLAVAFRFYVRLRLKRTPWIDDYAALSSAVLGAAYAAIAVAQTRWGLGLSAAYFPQSNVIPFGKIQYAGGPVYCMALLGFKVSLLASYMRIGGFVETYKRIIMVVIVACVCNQLAFTFVLSFACQPVAKQWDATLPGTCIKTVSSYYGLAGTSLGFDILIIALPLPVLMNLQLRRRQKIALMVIFALGFFVTIIQIIRIFSVKNLKTYTDSEPIVLWSIIEVSLGVISSCIPTYAPFFRAFATTLSSSYQYRRGHSKSNTYALATRGATTHASSHKSRQMRRKANRDTTTTTTTNTNFDPRDADLEILDDGTTLKGKGGGHSTTIMSMSVPAGKQKRDRDPVQRDSDSEELIRDSSGSGRNTSNGLGLGLASGSGSGSGSGTGLASPPGTSTSLEDPFQIHTMTEIKVERHEL